jgi:bifunctional non-homologous end joining protein LigD
VVRAAEALREELKDQGLESFVKTTGVHGLHVVVPIKADEPITKVQTFAAVTAAAAAQHHPDVITDHKEPAKVAINPHHNSANEDPVVAPYSVRALPHAPIAVPVAWEELPQLPSSDYFTLDNIEERFENDFRDPWANMHNLQQPLPDTGLHHEPESAPSGSAPDAPGPSHA